MVCKSGRNPRPFNKQLLASVAAKIWRGKCFRFNSVFAGPEAYPLSDKSDLVATDSLVRKSGCNPRPFNKELLASVTAEIWRGKCFRFISGSADPEAYPLSDKSCTPTSSPENDCNKIGQNRNKVAEQWSKYFGIPHRNFKSCM